MLKICHIYILIRPKQKSCLVSRNRPGENFVITHPPAQSNCIKIYIFNFKKITSKQTKTIRIKKKTKLKAKTKDEKKISPENGLKKNKLAAARVKIFLVTRISGNKSNFF